MVSSRCSPFAPRAFIGPYSDDCRRHRKHSPRLIERAGVSHPLDRTPTPHPTPLPVKVVSERLGHGNPGFTIDTYQHVLPGMQAKAAKTFEALVASARQRPPGRSKP